jgi:hypothetical protein
MCHYGRKRKFKPLSPAGKSYGGHSSSSSSSGSCSGTIVTPPVSGGDVPASGGNY